MIPRTLSASSAQVYETCPARWRAEYAERTPSPSGSAASLGTAVHGALELWIESGFHLTPPEHGEPGEAMRELYELAYRKEFADDSRYQEGLEMALRWLERQDWEGRTVLSTEVKHSFPIPTSIGDIPFNYIWDRCDRLDSGEIEVVDYKTYAAPLQPDHLKRRIQPRAYALAAQIAYPDAPRIWVTYDLLRYEPVGVVFSKDENRETWRYLKALAERVIEDDGTAEVLNPECRWCVRRHVCDTLTRHAAGGGVYGITDPEAAALRRYQLENAKKALDTMIGELDELILAHCEREETLGFTAGEVAVEITARRTRNVDTDAATRVIGSDLVAANTRLSMATVERLLKKDSPLTDGQRSELRQLIRYSYGEPSVRTKPLAPLGEDS